METARHCKNRNRSAVHLTRLAARGESLEWAARTALLPRRTQPRAAMPHFCHGLLVKHDTGLTSSGMKLKHGGKAISTRDASIPTPRRWPGLILAICVLVPWRAG